MAIYDEKLRSRFDWLREPDPDPVATPPLLLAFDLLYQDGREFAGRPLRERRARESTPGDDSDAITQLWRWAYRWRRKLRCRCNAGYLHGAYKYAKKREGRTVRSVYVGRA